MRHQPCDGAGGNFKIAKVKGQYWLGHIPRNDNPVYESTIQYKPSLPSKTKDSYTKYRPKHDKKTWQ